MTHHNLKFLTITAALYANWLYPPIKQQAEGRSLEAYLYAAYRRIPFRGTPRLEVMGIHPGEMRGAGMLKAK